VVLTRWLAWRASQIPEDGQHDAPARRHQEGRRARRGHHQRTYVDVASHSPPPKRRNETN
jgi:hypothetical protein